MSVYTPVRHGFPDGIAAGASRMPAWEPAGLAKYDGRFPRFHR